MRADVLSLVQPAMPFNKPTIGKKRQLLVPQGSNKRRSVQVGFFTTLVCSTCSIQTEMQTAATLRFMLGLSEQAAGPPQRVTVLWACFIAHS